MSLGRHFQVFFLGGAGSNNDPTIRMVYFFEAVIELLKEKERTVGLLPLPPVLVALPHSFSFGSSMRASKGEGTRAVARLCITTVPSASSSGGTKPAFPSPPAYPPEDLTVCHPWHSAQGWCPSGSVFVMPLAHHSMRDCLLFYILFKNNQKHLLACTRSAHLVNKRSVTLWLRGYGVIWKESSSDFTTARNLLLCLSQATILLAYASIQI